MTSTIKAIKAAVSGAQPDTLALLLAVRDFAWQSDVMVIWYVACRMVPAVTRYGFCEHKRSPLALVGLHNREADATLVT